MIYIYIYGIKQTLKASYNKCICRKEIRYYIRYYTTKIRNIQNMENASSQYPFPIYTNGVSTEFTSLGVRLSDTPYCLVDFKVVVRR